MTIRRAYIDTRSGQIHVRLAGDSTRPALVLLHQTSSSSAMFVPMMLALADDYRLIAPDVPGFGQSDPPRGVLRLDSYVEPLVEVLDALAVNTAFVFGHHSGTAVALRLEMLRPGLCRRMVLSGPAVLSDEVKHLLEATVRPVEPRDDGSHLLKMWRRIRDKDPNAPLDLSQRETVLNLMAGRVYDKMYRALLGYDFLADAGRVTCPVMLVAGDRDPLFGALAATMPVLQHGCEAVVAGAGTYICDRRAGALAALVRDFFNERELS